VLGSPSWGQGGPPACAEGWGGDEGPEREGRWLTGRRGGLALGSRPSLPPLELPQKECMGWNWHLGCVPHEQ